VAVRDFSGLENSPWALARAAASPPVHIIKLTETWRSRLTPGCG
jgi:hypothetical protein